MVRIINEFCKFLKMIDKGLYFPLWLLITGSFVLFFFGFVWTCFYVFFCSFLHAILLQFFPYVNDSNYYRYRHLRESFFKEKEVMKQPIKNSFVLGSYFFLFSSYWSALFAPQILDFWLIYLIPFFGVAWLIIFSTIGVEIINIVHRPQLPKDIIKYHPFLQRRYSPVVDAVINKVIPVCVQVGKVAVGGYTGFAVGYKSFNGIGAIDPLRNHACNLYHGFPVSHKWTEGSLYAWSSFKGSTLYSQLTYDESVKLFQSNEKKFTDAVWNQANPFLGRRNSK